MTPAERHCLQRLERHADQLSKLLQLLGGSRYVAGRDDEVIQGLHGTVKADLRKQSDECEAQGPALSKPAAIWLQPAVYDAFTALQASSAGPVERGRYDDVVKAHRTIDKTLLELNRRLDHEGGLSLGSAVQDENGEE